MCTDSTTSCGHSDPVVAAVTVIGYGATSNDHELFPSHIFSLSVLAQKEKIANSHSYRTNKTDLRTFNETVLVTQKCHLTISKLLNR